jgi:hypothetical protein
MVERERNSLPTHSCLPSLYSLVTLRWGGLGTYRNLRPLFLGFALGTIACAGLWLIIDAITGMKGNIVPMGVG